MTRSHPAYDITKAFIKTFLYLQVSDKKRTFQE